MPVQLNDGEIARLLRESKHLPNDFRARIKPRPKRGHTERELDVTGANGSAFRLIIRQSLANPLDFSIILGYRPPTTNQPLRLRRYNGRSHEHTNPIEGETFYDFHIHMVTERYQDLGMREDTFAERTDRYADLEGALRCMLADCGFVVPKGSQASLF